MDYSMIGLAWIQLTANGKGIPIEISNIRRVYPVTGSTGGSRITFKDGSDPLEVSETPAAVYTAINAKWLAWLAEFPA